MDVAYDALGQDAIVVVGPDMIEQTGNITVQRHNASGLASSVELEASGRVGVWSVVPALDGSIWLDVATGTWLGVNTGWALSVEGHPIPGSDNALFALNLAP